VEFLTWPRLLNPVGLLALAESVHDLIQVKDGEGLDNWKQNQDSHFGKSV